MQSSAQYEVAHQLSTHRLSALYETSALYMALYSCNHQLSTRSLISSLLIAYQLCTRHQLCTWLSTHAIISSVRGRSSALYSSLISSVRDISSVHGSLHMQSSAQYEVAHQLSTHRLSALYETSALYMALYTCNHQLITRSLIRFNVLLTLLPNETQTAWNRTARIWHDTLLQQARCC